MNVNDLYIDRVYKLCAPLMFLFVVYSYVFSVKPVFDQQQELIEKNSLLEKLTIEMRTLGEERKIALSELEETREKLASTSLEVLAKTENLNEKTKILDEVQIKLERSVTKLSILEQQINQKDKEITTKEASLAEITTEIGDKNNQLFSLAESLNRAENSAVTFYVYKVANEVASEGGFRNFTDKLGYRKSDSFNLYNSLMSKSEIDNSEKIERYSQKYYENKAKIIIRQFAKEKVSINEADHLVVFDIYTYVYKKLSGMSTD